MTGAQANIALPTSQLQEFIDFINRSYHVNIIIKEEKLKKLKFNGTIRKDEPLTNIIEKICNRP